MIPLQIKGATRVLGESQGYLKLPVRDDGVMFTAWEPTPDELKCLMLGAPVILMIAGTQHPPVALSVGDVP